MKNSTLDQISLSSFSLEPVWTIRVELGPEDDDHIRLALCASIGLGYASYDHVAFETATGTQYFRGREGTVSGAMEDATSRQVRALSFSIQRDESVLRSALDVIHRLHSYEEPVIYLFEAYATRTRPENRPDSSSKWWNNKTR